MHSLFCICQNFPNNEPPRSPHIQNSTVLVQLLSSVRLCATPWTVAHQVPLSMGFPRQEYWNRLPFPSPGDLTNSEIEPGPPVLQADSLLTEPMGKPKLLNVTSSPIPVHFSSLIPKMSIFTLAISCLTTSNLHWFMDLTFQVPMQYCSL